MTFLFRLQWAAAFVSLFVFHENVVICMANSSDAETCSAEDGRRCSANDLDKVGGVESTPCQDEEPKCSHWAGLGECEKNPAYMHVQCKQSCGLCPEKKSDQQQMETTTIEENSATTITAQTTTCQDLDDRNCSFWAKTGECDKNPAFMNLNCKKSCELCQYETTVADENDGPNNCTDNDEHCEEWADRGECTKNPNYMHEQCRLSCLKCSATIYSAQDLLDGLDLGVKQAPVSQKAKAADIKDRIESSRLYWKSSDILPGLKRICVNKEELCTAWAVTGECDKNPTYMKRNCAPACFSCTYLSIEGRCPIDPNEPNAWGPGDLEKMFTKLINEPYLSEYETQILSSPNTTGGPWVIQMENVITEDEANTLIALGATGDGYTRSADVGKLKADGTHERKVYSNRTSTTAWCKSGSECHNHELTQRVIERITMLTGLNETNSESLQLLRYEPGQFYAVHHDYIDYEAKRQQGPRILTLYLYLNDVEAGGGTNFDKLQLTVMPKRGRAVLWPSVFNDRPDEKDISTTHQALPVEAGIKYGANAWFHLRSFQRAYESNCT